MSTVSPPDSTLAMIRKKVRRLTASPSESSLRTTDIDEYINNFYIQDFPSSIKVDQLRDRYEFFTAPNIDTYPIDLNLNMSIRDPIYIEGRQGVLYKDWETFFRVYPRLPSERTPATGDGSKTSFTFTLGAPFLRKSVVIGTKYSSGSAVQIDDDGNSNLRLVATDSLGNKIFSTIGSVNYTTGAFLINFPVAPGAAEPITVFYSAYIVGRPYSVLFWKNEFTVRPVPDKVYKIEVETYQTPTQFLTSSDNPKLNQWAQYIAYGAALEVLRERQDVEGINAIMEGFKRQEAMVLERQANDQIGVHTKTLFNSPIGNSYWGYN